MAEELLPIHGKIFETHKGFWRARVVNRSDPASAEYVCYMIEFRLVEEACPARDLKLWVSNLGLHVERSKYQSDIFDSVKLWLETDPSGGELSANDSGLVFSFSYRPRPVEKDNGALSSLEPIDRASIAPLLRSS